MSVTISCMHEAMMNNLSVAPPNVLLFDVNETLLDLTPLEERINEVLLQEGAAKLWFATMLQYSLAMTVNNQHAPLIEIGSVVLVMLARNREVVLSEEEARDVLKSMLSLPAHPDVELGLQQLKDVGYRLAALTNSSQTGVKSQLEYAGLTDCFEKQLSVESIQRYKPHRDVYHWAARQMGVNPEECMLVAAHGWDVAGAKWAGLQAAFIARAGQQLFSLGMEPDLIAPDLLSLAKRLDR